MKYIYLFLTILISSAALGQGNGLIEARTLQAEGKMREALAVIKNAVTKSEFAKDGGAWYTYAELNKTLFQEAPTEDEKSAYLSEAIKGYQMTLKYPSENVRINLSAGQSIDVLFQKLIQNGATLYQQQKYDAALEAFNNAIIIEPKDSTIITYAANAAVQANRYDQALANFQKLLNLNPKESIYQNMVSIQKDTQKDFDGALVTIEQAQLDFPDSEVFDRYKLDIFLAQERDRDAIDLIAEMLKKSDQNGQLALRKAVLHDKFIGQIKSASLLDSAALQTEIDKAEAAYLASLSSAPKNVTANFNLAMLYNDQANTYYRSINAMTLDQYKEESEAYEEKALDFIRKALARMEMASEQKPEDIDILKTLAAYYDRLSMGDKKRTTQAKIVALGG